jgi:hypothetical protein
LLIDLIIVMILLLALVIGYDRGVLQPLLVEIFFLVTLVLIIRERAGYTRTLDHYLHTNAVFDVFLALILAVVAGYIGGVIGQIFHRMPIIRGVDGFLGIFVHLGVAVLLVYLLLSALVAMDKAFGPTINATSLNYTQVEKLKSQLNSNPLSASLVDSKEIARLEADSKTKNGARLETVNQLHQMQTVYVDFLQPQLAGSRLAPYILAIGSRVPGLGHYGAADVPKPATAPRTSPTPSPKK